MSYFNTIKQDIKTSTNNYTTDNLVSGATYTGTADETFGINGIQIFFASDVDCRIYLDQGITDEFGTGTTVIDYVDCLASLGPCTRTFTSVSPYFRIRVTNISTNTSTFLVAAAGLTPIINPLPRALSEDGRLKTEVQVLISS